LKIEENNMFDIQELKGKTITNIEPIGFDSLKGLRVTVRKGKTDQYITVEILSGQENREMFSMQFQPVLILREIDP